jgi:hypothetical protein
MCVCKCPVLVEVVNVVVVVLELVVVVVLVVVACVCIYIYVCVYRWERVMTKTLGGHRSPTWDNGKNKLPKSTDKDYDAKTKAHQDEVVRFQKAKLCHEEVQFTKEDQEEIDFRIRALVGPTKWLKNSMVQLCLLLVTLFTLITIITLITLITLIALITLITLIRFWPVVMFVCLIRILGPLQDYRRTIEAQHR